MTADLRPPAAVVPVAEALRFWFRLGWISFGGPAGQIALMHEELVVRRRWISERRFLHALNYCMLLPGPEAQQLATYLGWLMHRTWGGVVAGLLFVLPSLAILVLLSWLYLAWGHTAWLAGMFYGIKPAVVAIVAQAAQRMASRTLHHPLLWGLALLSFVLVWGLAVPFPWIVLGAALLGVAGGQGWPQVFAVGKGHAAAGTGDAAALIDDHTPIPAHAQFRAARLLQVLALGALLWLLPMAVLTLTLGWTHTLTQMGWFFTKAALLTFGGAYAVLPYLYQGAVGHYGWLTPTQMLDGLALGETTPGPLIMVVAFVGFVGGYTEAFWGSGQPWLAGLAAALLVSWFTFLPSFVFILAGGPLVESSRHQPKLNAPLTAISAAVVGVIAHLALFFAGHVLWPQGLGSPPDLIAAGLAVAAALALWVAKRPVLEVIAGAALLGWLLHVG